MAEHHVYLGLGSNLGDRYALMKRAIRMIDERVGQVVRVSSFIESEPWGFESEHRFLNAVLLCRTTLTPREVLQLTQRIECDMGRKKKSQAQVYHDRPIDIDILLYDDLTIDEPDLQIPHPLMYERDFVMKPLEEIKY